MRLDAHRVAEAFRAACADEIAALKPGNVHRFAPGHDMDARTFAQSADASAPAIASPGAPVGRRILEATRASLAAVGCNANLGIVLLAAPLAAAAERDATSGDLHANLCQVLAELTREDARDAFAAIALAAPGGLGTVPDNDVRHAPETGLVEAMRLAAGRDRVARQYATGFDDILSVGLRALARAAARPGREVREAAGFGPAFEAFMAFVTRFPDSHVARKYGAEIAEDVRRRFLGLAEEIDGLPVAQMSERAFAFDAALKRDGINPGTCADLTVASLFAARLLQFAGA